MRNKKINVLVTGVGSNIGQGIVRSLRMSKGSSYRVIGTDADPLAVGLFRCCVGYVVPLANDPQFIPELIKICNRENIDIILIGSNPETPIISRSRNYIEKKSGSFVLVSTPDFVKLTFDKWETYNLLKKEGLDYAETALGNSKKDIKNLIDKAGFPLIVKPRKSSGSRNVFKVGDMKELVHALNCIKKDSIVQEYLLPDDEEYTCGIFFSKDSKVKGIITMKRKLLFGTTYTAFIDSYKKVQKDVEKVAGVLGKYGAIGPINIQARLKNRKQLVVFEINPRFSGTVAFRAKMGFNEPDVGVKHFLLGQNIGTMRHRRGLVMRYWEEVCVPLKEAERLLKNKRIENPDSSISVSF